jgi:hypothetical protein
MNKFFKSIPLFFALVICACNSPSCCSGAAKSCSVSCASNNKINADSGNPQSSIHFLNGSSEKEACPKCGKNSCTKECASSEFATVTEGEKLKSIVPSCNLSASQMVDRRTKLTSKYSMFQKVKKVVEMEDGYDFVFSEPKEFSQKLLEFINFERACCSNFSFALEFEPNEKATHLKMYGSPAIKQELKNGFKELGVIK